MKDQIRDHLIGSFPGVISMPSWGEEAFFYNPGMLKPRGVYFATLKEKDGPNDRASGLDRGGVYRFNIGLTKEDYLRMFGPPPARPPKGGVVETEHDFTACDVVTPHPVYGWMSWISVLNPSCRTLEQLQPSLVNAYALARHKFDKAIKSARG